MVITVHWIDEERRMRHAVLGFAQLAPSHKGVHIRSVVMAVSESTKLPIGCTDSQPTVQVTWKTCFEALSVSSHGERRNVGLNNTGKCL